MDGIERPHPKSRAPKIRLSRRDFVVTGITAGFALAVQPVQAQTVITTDTNGLVAGPVEIPVSDGTIPGYRARPDGKGPYATVLVIHEAWGVHEHIQDICRRLAKVGYFAVAPELFARQGDPRALTDTSQILQQIINKVPDAEVASDLDATVAWARKDKAANTVKLGVTGFCWGGRQVWMYAFHNPKLKAAVSWYGFLNHPDSPITPKGPLDLVARLKVPVLGLYGGADSNIPVAQVKEMEAKLKAAHKHCEFMIYPDAPHAFNADYRPSYRPEAAKDGWARTLAWFKAHGVA
ncbi:MAG TPA: dienelactone hydrolase family protein [Stellaceae bacterium]|jgi:carboxymethylenebutenolidase|nr:dienelactone hydrolase family protein [Stellaceae bacterium]